MLPPPLPPHTTTEHMTTPTDEETRLRAFEEYGSDEIEIEDDAKVSRPEERGDGAFVQAWVWVADPS